MSQARPYNGVPEDKSDLQVVVDGITDFGQRVTSTASAWINPSSTIVKDITPHLKRPSFQKRLLSSTSPSELLRTNLSPSEISYRQITYLSEEMLRDIPEDDGSQSISLFQGFEASLPDTPRKSLERKRISHHSHRRSSSIQGRSSSVNGRIRQSRTPDSAKWEKERDLTNHKLEVLGVRKALASQEIKEIDGKLAKLNSMRSELIAKLEQFEIMEAETVDELQDIETKLEEAKEVEELAEVATPNGVLTPPSVIEEEADFLSQSTYGSLSSHSAKQQRKRKAARRRSSPLLHQHFESGALIKAMPAHADIITALDFDYPMGTMVTASVDDTVRVWNLATGRCQGLLEGHIASVRCLQLEDTLVATGSADARIKLWDLGQSDQYAAVPPSAVSKLINKNRNESADDLSQTATAGGRSSRQSNTDSTQSVDCCVYTFDAHVGDVSALHFIGSTLVSGSSDRTIRQWDMNTGKLLQTMDILAYSPRTTFTVDQAASPPADFVGALQCFEQGLAAGTADGMVRFWDLRTGQVARELQGHTGPVTCLQFDDIHLVSGSLDRSVRIWDLRTGTIHDAYAYEKGIQDLCFDRRKIVTAAGERTARVYDRVEGRHWPCGEEDPNDSVVSVVRFKESTLLGGRSDGTVSIWSL
ncbi:WD40-repeat-containing domain protein [Protomyces lactucae-debilis]|uniref:WD40-repeat-containing domain protein n=1 Tax=Protomyces lactucae-debilis TaxID=2754530 RepID=A0A1Y2FNT8_PROLT|nr:WD40-repeat-containing domain protein [Protomyces lactucae-debilis]ORY85638.1 WD40-repeat-containing domain protein [Protomyces lactucae-debilis]